MPNDSSTVRFRLTLHSRLPESEYMPSFTPRAQPMRQLTLGLLLALVAPMACVAPAGSITAEQQPAAPAHAAHATDAADIAPTTIILVRHAEKAPAPANDPPLDSIGMHRARMLLDVVRDANVGAVYITPFARTRLTADPVAKARGLTPIVVPTTGGGAVHVTTVADRVRAEQRGRTTLVVGHSNTIPAIVRALGGTAPAELAEHQYDDLFVVTILPSGEVTTLRARYGPANPAPGTTPAMR